MTHPDRRHPLAPHDDMESRRRARAAAAQLRAEYLIPLALGVLTMTDVISEAVDQEPLRKISLRQLITNQPGVGEAAADRILRRLSQRVPVGTKPLTIGWLLDKRTGGARLRAWLDVAEQRKALSGFPFRAA